MDSCFNYLTISDECVLNRIIHLIASIFHFTLSEMPQFARVLCWWIHLSKATIFSFIFPNFILVWPLKFKLFGGILWYFILGDLSSESFGNGISQVLWKTQWNHLWMIVSIWRGFKKQTVQFNARYHVCRWSTPIMKLLDIDSMWLDLHRQSCSARNKLLFIMETLS